MDATWQRLGDAAGTRGVGVNRVRVEPGKLPTPPHSHGASEELYFVLAGSGLAWQDGDVHEVRPLDCVIHRAGRDGAHVRRRARRARVPRLRHAAPDGDRLAAALARDPVRLALGRGARRRPVGRRGDRRAARGRRAGAAAGEHRQRRRGRARDGRATRRSPTSRRDETTTLARACLGEAPRRATAAPSRTATRRRRRSSSSSRARRRSSCGRAERRASRRHRSGPATSSRVRRGHASPTPSAQARTA